MTTEIYSRIARLEDAEAIRTLAERTFRDTFGDANQSEDMETYVRDALSLEQTRMELADEQNTFFVAHEQHARNPLGFAKLRLGSTEPCVVGAEPIELERLYVDAALIGAGVGALLMNASLEYARTSGCQTIWLGVWEHNPRAIAFYERWGFTIVGDHIFQLGADAQKDLVMMRSLVTDSSHSAD